MNSIWLVVIIFRKNYGISMFNDYVAGFLKSWVSCMSYDICFDGVIMNLPRKLYLTSYKLISTHPTYRRRDYYSKLDLSKSKE